MAFIDVHLFPHLHDHGISDSVGASAVAVLGALEIIGALAAGRLCDLGWTRATLIGAYAMRATAMVMLLFVGSPATVIAFGAVFGASYLATVIATTVWVTRTLPPPGCAEPRSGCSGQSTCCLWRRSARSGRYSLTCGTATPSPSSRRRLTAVSVVLVIAQPSPDGATAGPESVADDARPHVEV